MARAEEEEEEERRATTAALSEREPDSLFFLLLLLLQLLSLCFSVPCLRKKLNEKKNENTCVWAGSPYFVKREKRKKIMKEKKEKSPPAKTKIDLTLLF